MTRRCALCAAGAVWMCEVFDINEYFFNFYFESSALLSKNTTAPLCFCGGKWDCSCYDTSSSILRHVCLRSNQWHWRHKLKCKHYFNIFHGNRAYYGILAPLQRILPVMGPKLLEIVVEIHGSLLDFQHFLMSGAATGCCYWPPNLSGDHTLHGNTPFVSCCAVIFTTVVIFAWSSWIFGDLPLCSYVD